MWRLEASDFFVRLQNARDGNRSSLNASNLTLATRADFLLWFRYGSDPSIEYDGNSHTVALHLSETSFSFLPSRALSWIGSNGAVLPLPVNAGERDAPHDPSSDDADWYRNGSWSGTDGQRN